MATSDHGDPDHYCPDCTTWCRFFYYGETSFCQCSISSCSIEILQLTALKNLTKKKKPNTAWREQEPVCYFCFRYYISLIRSKVRKNYLSRGDSAVPSCWRLCGGGILPLLYEDNSSLNLYHCDLFFLYSCPRTIWQLSANLVNTF